MLIVVQLAKKSTPCMQIEIYHGLHLDFVLRQLNSTRSSVFSHPISLRCILMLSCAVCAQAFKMPSFLNGYHPNI